MDPIAEWTRLECWDDAGKPFLKEYVGGGKLQGKKAIVTGGDSGIGRSAAQMFAREGADVTIVYLPEEEVDAQNVLKAIEADGRKCLLLPLDLTKEENTRSIVEKHIKEYGKLDILVNNASKQIMCEKLEDIDVSWACRGWGLADCHADGQCGEYLQEQHTGYVRLDQVSKL